MQNLIVLGCSIYVLGWMVKEVLEIIFGESCHPTKAKKCAKCRIRNECGYLAFKLKVSNKFRLKYAKHLDLRPAGDELFALIDKYGLDASKSKKHKKKHKKKK